MLRANTKPRGDAQVSAVLNIGGTAGYYKAKKEYKELCKYKKKTKLVTEVYFKWRNPKKLTYTVKISRYFTYNGKKVSKVQNTYKNGEF